MNETHKAQSPENSKHSIMRKCFESHHLSVGIAQTHLVYFSPLCHSCKSSSKVNDRIVIISESTQKHTAASPLVPSIPT